MSTATINPSNSKVVNGVNLTQLAENIRSIRKQPELADFKFRAHNLWIDGGHNQTEIKDYFGLCQEIHSRYQPFVLDADEPPVLLGEDRGANPVEYLLASLSSCMTTALAYHAAVHGLKLESIESQLEGDIDMHGFLDLDPKVRKGYTEIRIKMKVKGEGDPDTWAELAKKSPTYDTVSGSTDVKLIVEKVKGKADPDR
jgi:uncharacterized OsmC-like protein